MRIVLELHDDIAINPFYARFTPDVRYPETFYVVTIPERDSEGNYAFLMRLVQESERT